MSNTVFTNLYQLQVLNASQFHKEKGFWFFLIMFFHTCIERIFQVLQVEGFLGKYVHSMLHIEIQGETLRTGYVLIFLLKHSMM